MPVRRMLPLLAMAAVLAACGHGTITVAPPSAARAGDYSPADRLRVMLAPPGVAGEAASRRVSARVVDVLQQTHADVALLATSELMQALADAREAKATYLVVPSIVEWADGHAPPFTADRIKVQLELRAPADGEVVSTVTYANVSPLFEVTDSGPEALLGQGFDKAVTVLIETGAPPKQ